MRAPTSRAGRLTGGARGVLAAAVTAWVAATGPQVTAQAADPVPVRADFNGDGIADLAVGVPFEDIGTAADAGAVQVYYGGPLGPSAGGANGQPVNLFLHQNVSGVPGTSEAGDQFGRAIAAGDFDDDGFTDLAVGVPFDDTSSNQAADAGLVLVVFGSATGLNPGRTQELVSQKAGEQFGFALAAGDFDGDGVHDLAVGAPERIVSTVALGSCWALPTGQRGCGTAAERAGGVSVFMGSVGTGLSTASAVAFRQSDDIDGVISTMQEVGDAALAGERFGEVLAAGDFDDDGTADLVVGVPGNDLVMTSLTPIANSGLVHVVYGSTSGLGRRSSQPALSIGEDGVSQGGGWFIPGVGAGDGITGTAQAGDLFGASLAVGRRNGADALYIGVPGEDVGVVTPSGITTVQNAGSVLELRRAGTGPEMLDHDVVWSQETAGVEGATEAGDQFGFALASADFNGDGRPDLAVGVPFEDVASGGTSRGNAGAVNVLYGASSGLSASGDQIWTQASDPTFGPGTAETNAEFGRALTASDMGGGERGDLAIASPGRNTGGVTDAGMVQVLFGTQSGLALGGNVVLHQDQPGVADANETSDRQGWVLR